MKRYIYIGIYLQSSRSQEGTHTFSERVSRYMSFLPFPRGSENFAPTDGYTIARVQKLESGKSELGTYLYIYSGDPREEKLEVIRATFSELFGMNGSLTLEDFSRKSLIFSSSLSVLVCNARVHCNFGCMPSCVGRSGQGQLVRTAFASVSVYVCVNPACSTRVRRERERYRRVAWDAIRESGIAVTANFEPGFGGIERARVGWWDREHRAVAESAKDSSYGELRSWMYVRLAPAGVPVIPGSPGQLGKPQVCLHRECV